MLHYAQAPAHAIAEASRLLGPGADPLTDIPKVLAHAAEGRLDLGALVTGTVGLDGIDGAFAEMAAGRGARTIVVP